MSRPSFETKVVRALISTLRRTRLAHSLTQEQVAKAARLHASSVARFERGRQRDTSLVFLMRYARGLRKLGADLPPRLLWLW